jgi:hypothetical protein
MTNKKENNQLILSLRFWAQEEVAEAKTAEIPAFCHALPPKVWRLYQTWARASGIGSYRPL